MYLKGLFFCFVIVLKILSLKAENSYEAKLRLENMLMTNYNRAIRPALKDGDNVTVTVGISLNHINEMDDRNQVLKLSLWLRQKWYDGRLSWDPAKFRWVNTTQIYARKLWVPDLKVYNEAERRVDSGLDQFQTKAIISHNGEIKWMAPAVMKLSCQVDVTYFPYDTQICRAKIGSWTYDGFAIDVQPESYTMDISKSPSNPEWVLVSTSVQKNIEYYPCCPEPYPDVTYTIKIKRRMQSYWVNFLFPGILLTLMTMMTFLTPATDTGERVSLVLTSCVSMFVFLKMVAERTPASDTIPLLSIYFLIFSSLIALIFYSACFSVNTFHKHPAMGDMPGYMRTIVLEMLGKVWGLTKERESIKQKLDQLRNNLLFNNETKVQIEKRKSQNDVKLSLPNNFESQNLRRRKTADSGEMMFRSSTTASTDVFQSTSSAVNLKEVECDEVECDEVFEAAPANTAKKHGYLVCSCPYLLRKMVKSNRKLLSSLGEIVYVARHFDKTSSKKEHWLVAAAILDRTFLVLFVLIFVVICLVNFPG